MPSPSVARPRTMMGVVMGAGCAWRSNRRDGWTGRHRARTRKVAWAASSASWGSPVTSRQTRSTIGACRLTRAANADSAIASDRGTARGVPRHSARRPSPRPTGSGSTGRPPAPACCIRHPPVLLPAVEVCAEIAIPSKIRKYRPILRSIGYGRHSGAPPGPPGFRVSGRDSASPHWPETRGIGTMDNLQTPNLPAFRGVHLSSGLRVVPADSAARDLPLHLR